MPTSAAALAAALLLALQTTPPSPPIGQRTATPQQLLGQAAAGDVMAEIEAQAASEMLVTWIGHATVLVQAGGLNILTDPIWSERASPFSFVGPKRVRAPGVRFEDLPKIDLVLISHNHYDHMDLPTLKRLWERDRPLIVTSLGNDTILRSHRHRGARARLGRERRSVGPPSVVVERNHHWGSRWGTDRNRALWSGLHRSHAGGNIFFAGDTGWGDGSWVREAAARGPYRLAIIPIGAYEPRDFMKTNHINPDEAVASSSAEAGAWRSACTGARSSSPSRRSTIRRGASPNSAAPAASPTTAS
jgi:L-ascorbate metabolism protein UlaG (beta-lactamase superfamily)